MELWRRSIRNLITVSDVSRVRRKLCLPDRARCASKPGPAEDSVAGKRVIGGYFDATGTHGFELKGGNFRSIDCPRATSVFLSGLDPQGDMTGEVTGSDGIQHGLLVRDGNCITVDFPGSLPGSNYANGINPRGDIVGRYATLDGKVHAYLQQ
jgi:hypothetical protein